MFKGNKGYLVRLIEGKVGQESIIPQCFSDPDLLSGECNAMMPVHNPDSFLCAFSKSCLVAKLISKKVKVDLEKAPSQSYEQLLADGDALFEQESEPAVVVLPENDEITARQKLRAHVVSISIAPPPINPFRKNSLRSIILDILSRDWITLGELRAAVVALKPNIKCLDLVIGQVTNIATQEQNGYRVVEAFKKYRAFNREE